MPGRVYVSGTPTREGFTGHELDAETGMNYAGARYYMPALGRFTSTDPHAASYPHSSPFSYALNNPISFIDPDGMDTKSTHINSVGEVIAVYDDGDLNVYQHNDINGYNPDQGAEVNRRRNASGRTSGGGEYVGYTLSRCSFASSCDSDAQPRGFMHLTGGKSTSDIVDRYMDIADNPPGYTLEALSYARNAGSGGFYDIKSGPESRVQGGAFNGLYFNGTSGLITSLRDAGNILAGRVAANVGHYGGTMLYGYGQYAKDGGNNLGYTIGAMIRSGVFHSEREGMRHMMRYEERNSAAAIRFGFRGF